MAKTAQDVLRQIKDEGIELIDLKFVDLHGKWQHLTVCSDLLDADAFTDGVAFDGSSIRGWKAIFLQDVTCLNEVRDGRGCSACPTSFLSSCWRCRIVTSVAD